MEFRRSMVTPIAVDSVSEYHSMDNKLTEDFLEGVNEVISSDEDKDRLFQSLRDYRDSLDLDTLLRSLRSLVVSPDRLPLYDAVRPLVPVQHQLSFDRRTCWASTQRRLRVVRLPRRDLPPGVKLGFAVRGGLEHGVGFFVSQVAPDSMAARAGLRVGDQIMRINGFLIEHATHAEAVALIRSRSDLLMKVRRVGMLPSKEPSDDSVAWAAPDGGPPADDVSAAEDSSELRLYLNTRGAPSLGCTVVSGPAACPGIFVQSLVPDGLTEQAGLRPGDQILAVNGVSFLDISHANAILTLKSSAGLLISVRRGTGLFLVAGNGDADVDSREALERRKLAQLRALTAARQNDLKMTVTRHTEDELAATVNVDSGSGTLTPSVGDRESVKEPVPNNNVFFRRSDEPHDFHPRSSSPPLKQSPPVVANSFEERPKSSQQSSSAIVESELQFSRHEAGGRQVESVRLCPRPPVWEVSGLELEEVPGGRVVVAQVDYGSPAFQADVRKGDYLLAIDRDRLSGKRLAAVAELLRRAEKKPQFILTLGRAPSGIYDDEVTYF